MVKYFLATIPDKDREEKCPFAAMGEFWPVCALLKENDTDCIACKAGLTKDEIINWMVTAMYDPYFNDVHACEEDMLKALAEAALDALVGKINLPALDKLNKVN